MRVIQMPFHLLLDIYNFLFFFLTFFLRGDDAVLEV
jgi:hypothetical protein